MGLEVNNYFNNIKNRKEELLALRCITLSCKLTETLKWKAACYTYEGKNITILGILKDAVILSFFKGVLLKDKNQLLIKPGQNSQSARYLKFDSLEEIARKKFLIKSYLLEAIENEKSGKKVVFKKVSNDDFPEELEAVFKKDQKFQDAFLALTPGRQRGYLLHFSGAKQSKTRLSRIEQARPKVMLGKGIHDCICGLSKIGGRCDGSHRKLKV